MRFLAQVGLIGAVVVLAAWLVSKYLPSRWERAISTALDFEQK